MREGFDGCPDFFDAISELNVPVLHSFLENDALDKRG